MKARVKISLAAVWSLLALVALGGGESIRLAGWREFTEPEAKACATGLWMFSARYYPFDVEARGHMLLPVSKAGELQAVLAVIEVFPEQQAKAVGRLELAAPQNKGPIFVVDLAPLPVGRYVVRGRLIGADGKEVAVGQDTFEKIGVRPGKPERCVRVPVLLDVPAPAAGKRILSTAVAVPEGAVYEAGNVRVINRAGCEVPSQVEPFLKWRENGSYKWLRVEFVAETKETAKIMDVLAGAGGETNAPYFVEMGSEVRRQAVPASIKIAERPDGVEVDTGVLRAEITRGQGLIGAIDLDTDGDGHYAPDERVTAGAMANRLIDQNGTVYNDLKAGTNTVVVVEEAGPLHTVIRVEGKYCSAVGTCVSRYTARLHFYANESQIRIDHTWILSGDSREYQFKDIALVLPLSNLGTKRTLRFDKKPDSGSEVWERELAGGGRAFLLQDMYHHHGQRKAHGGIYTAGSGGAWQVEHTTGQIGEWLDLTGADWGVTVVLRDLWQQFPKELEVNGDELNIHLWSGRRAKATTAEFDEFLLDFRAAAMVQYWGEAIFRDETYPNAKKDPAEIAKMSFHATGVGKTHEILIRFHGREPAAQTVQAADEFQMPILALAHPGWTMASGVFPPYHPYDPQRFQRFERVLDKTVEFHIWAADRSGSYGFVEYGAAPYFLYKSEKGMKRTFAKDDLLEPSLYRYVGHEYGSQWYFWLNYLRSGDRRWYTLARRHTLFLIDWLFYHLPEYASGRYNDYASIYFFAANNTLLQWSFLPDSARYLDLVGGLRRGSDVANENAAAFRRQISSPDWFTVPSSMSKLRARYGMLISLTSHYNYTWDPQYACAQEELAERLIALDSPSGVLPGSTACNPGKTGQTQVMLLPVLKYYEISNKEKALSAAHKLCANFFRASVPNFHGYSRQLAPLVWSMDYFLNGNRLALSCALRHLTTPYNSAAVGIDHFPAEGYYAHMDISDYITFFCLPHLMAALAHDNQPLPEWPLWSAQAFTEFSVYIDDPDDRPISLVFSSLGEKFPLVAREYRARSDVPRVDVFAPSGKRIENAGLRVEPIDFMGSKSSYCELSLPADGEKGTYTIRFIPEDFRNYASIFAYSCSHEKLVLGLAPYMILPAKPMYFFVPKDTKQFWLDGHIINMFVGPNGGAKSIAIDQAGKHLITVDPGEDGKIWSLLPHQQVGPFYFYLNMTGIPPFLAVGDARHYFQPQGPAVVQPAAESKQETPLREGGGFCAGRFGQAFDPKSGLTIGMADAESSRKIADLDLSRGTVEFWFRPSGNRMLWDMLVTLKKENSADAALWLDYRDQYREFHVLDSGGLIRQLMPGQWHHIALSYDLHAKEINLFLNGAGERFKTGLSPADFQGAFSLIDFLKRKDGKPSNLKGCIDDIRISKVQRYKDGFLPPDREFACDADTVMLFHLNGSLAGESGVPGLRVTCLAGHSEEPRSLLNDRIKPVER